MCLQTQGIDDGNSDVGRVRQDRGLIHNNGGISRGRGIRGASDGLETMTDVAGDR